jgi:hypothetical protein
MKLRFNLLKVVLIRVLQQNWWLPQDFLSPISCG